MRKATIRGRKKGDKSPTLPKMVNKLEGQKSVGQINEEEVRCRSEASRNWTRRMVCQRELAGAFPLYELRSGPSTVL